jgi:hypothetical protein
MMHDDKVTEPCMAKTPPPLYVAVFPLMVLDEMATVPNATNTPPPYPPAWSAMFPLMVHDEMATVPCQTATPPPKLASEFPEIEEDVIVTAPELT